MNNINTQIYTPNAASQPDGWPGQSHQGFQYHGERLAANPLPCSCQRVCVRGQSFTTGLIL